MNDISITEISEETKSQIRDILNRPSEAHRILDKLHSVAFRLHLSTGGKSWAWETIGQYRITVIIDGGDMLVHFIDMAFDDKLSVKNDWQYAEYVISQIIDTI